MLLQSDCLHRKTFRTANAVCDNLRAIAFTLLKPDYVLIVLYLVITFTFVRVRYTVIMYV